MRKTFSFRWQIRLLVLIALPFAVIAIAGGAVILKKYDNLLQSLQDSALGQIQRYEDVELELASIHLRVTQVIAARTSATGEQGLYAESKSIAGSIDALISALPGESNKAAEEQGSGAGLFRQAILRYRSDIILALEMLTVNPQLADRYIARSAMSLSEMNISIAKSSEMIRHQVDREMQSTLTRTKIETVLLAAIIFVGAVTVILMNLSLTRKLTQNFQAVEDALVKLGSGNAAISLPADVGDGEFRGVVSGLRRFREVLIERDISRLQMKSIFDSILEGVIVIDERGEIVQTNPVAGTLFGYAEDELLGKNVRILTPVEIESSHDHYLEQYRKTGKAGVVGKVRTLEGRRRDGSVFPIQLSVNKVVVGDSKFFVGVIADISERVENERLLRQARDAALNSARIKADFLATMSHEIRTPMNGILGMAQLLADEGIGEEQSRQCARTLLGSSQTLITLLNDILDLSKVESGSLVFKPEPVTPAALADETAALFIEAAQSKGLRVSVSVSPSARQRFMLDPVRVRQMLSNLVGNAVKFTDAGAVRIELAVEEESETAGELLFRVVDTGPGIENEDLARLFDKYSQLDSSTTRRHGGSGLGLSIVRQFARAMQGHVGVESVPGDGSTFWFRIPADKAVKSERAEAESPAGADLLPNPEARAELFQGHVLIAEDTPANRFFLQLALKRLGLSTHVAENGREALGAVIDEGPFDCVFMDMRMPEMDGEESTRLIREWELTSARQRCPIIAVTANAYDDDRQSCLDAGMDDFLAKPVKIDDLKRILRRWVSPREAIKMSI